MWFWVDLICLMWMGVWFSVRFVWFIIRWFGVIDSFIGVVSCRLGVFWVDNVEIVLFYLLLFLLGVSVLLFVSVNLNG